MGKDIIKILDRQIIQANPLIEARKQMNTTQLRLFVLGLQDVKPRITEETKQYDLDFHDTWITPAELEELFRGHRSGITNIKKQLREAFAGYIEIEMDGGGITLYHIYEKLTYVPNKGLLIKFDNNMKPYILDLIGKAYTSYSVKTIFPLSSEYAWRILELLLEKQMFFKEEYGKHDEVYVRMTIEETRFKLNVPSNLYVKRLDNFRSRVLELPIKEINEKTEYEVWYETEKKGRITTGFVIWMKKKISIATEEKEEKKALPAPISEEEKLEKETGQGKLMDYPSETTTKPRGLSDEEQEAYDSLVNRGVAIKKAKELAKKYELKRIKRNMEIAVRQKDTSRNLPGLIISMIEQDTAGQQEIAKQEARARIEAKQLDRRQAYDAWHGTNMASIGKARADKGEERKEEAPPAQKELTELEANIIIQAGEKALKPVIEKMKKLGLTIEEVKAGKRK